MTKRENLLRTIRREKPASVPYRYDGCLTMVDAPVSARPREGGLDDWGVLWTPSGTEEGSYPASRGASAVYGKRPLVVPETDFVAVTTALRKELAALTDRDTLVVVRDEGMLFERLGYLLGPDEYLIAFVSEPQKVGAMLEVIGAYQIRLVEAIMAAGAEAVRFTDDWGMQKSLFINPSQWRELIKPHLARLYGAVKRHGGLVFQHSCGCIEEIVEDLIDIGLDVLDPCQPQANDIFAWKRRYGDSLCFMGGLDTQSYLSFGTPEEVEIRVTEVLSKMSSGGGYIVAPSHTITLPEENRRAMIRAIDAYNRRYRP